MTTISDTTVNEEVEPPCKKTRLQDRTHFTHLKLHNRLIIYDYVDLHETEHCDDGTVTRFFCASNLSESFARMSVLASILGDLDTLQYLAGIPDNNIFIPEIYGSELDMDEEELEGVYDTEFICYYLASYGHWNALKWAISKQYPRKYITLEGAVEGGADVEMLQWLYSQGCRHIEFSGYSMLKFVARRGDWSVMKWLRQIGCHWDPADQCWNWTTMDWLREIGCPWNWKTFAAALKKYDVDVLSWLKDNGCPWNKDVFYAAVEQEDFKLLVWLRMEGCPWDSRIFNHALNQGADLVTLKWFLYEDISLMDDNTFNAAIDRGDMNILKWLRTKNCKVTKHTFIYAIEQKVPMDIMKWMWMYYSNVRDEDVFSSAVKRGDLILLKWLRKKKCPWNSACYKVAFVAKRFDIVQWLHEEQCPHDEETCKLVMREFIKLYKEQNAS